MGSLNTNAPTKVLLLTLTNSFEMVFGAGIFRGLVTLIVILLGVLHTATFGLNAISFSSCKKFGHKPNINIVSFKVYLKSFNFSSIYKNLNILRYELFFFNQNYIKTGAQSTICYLMLIQLKERSEISPDMSNFPNSFLIVVPSLDIFLLCLILMLPWSKFGT